MRWVQIISLLIIFLAIGCKQKPVTSSKEPVNNKKNTQADVEQLMIHCAAGMRSPIEQIKELFEKSRNISIVLNYDGSNRLLGAIELSKKGDLYITGDADYLEIVQQKNLVLKSEIICYFEPVIMVTKDNPNKITSLKSLINTKIKIAQGDERSAAVGRLTPKLLEINGIDKGVWDRNVVLKTPTVSELALAVKLGTVDATIVWATIAKDFQDVAQIVKIPENSNIFPAVGAAILSCSSNKKAAEDFLNFLNGPEGERVLVDQGYQVQKP